MCEEIFKEQWKVVTELLDWELLLTQIVKSAKNFINVILR